MKADMQSLQVEIAKAKSNLAQARQNEALADPEFLEIAMERTNAAMAHLNSLYKQAKLM